MANLFDMLFDKEEMKNQINIDEGAYTAKSLVPQYKPNNNKPSVSEMVDISKYNELINEIEQSNISSQDKYFLKLAATRHIVFTYDKIADYYANSSKEVQELMEKSALVLIDLEDAIANDYVLMSERIAKIRERDILLHEEVKAEKAAAKNG